ncbi:MAG: arylsulfatase, partial [Verrucomicrobiae bacterium]|nr:arylsulfatase [Verrucomicrobiae bacterium]
LQSHRGDAPISFHNIAVRSQRWKLVHPTGFGREQMPGDVSWELYDMSQDLAEGSNLVTNQPAEMKRLAEAYAAWFKDVSSTRPDNYAPPRIVIGSDHDVSTLLTRQDWRVDDPEGWGKGGRWLLHAERDGVYDLILRWPEPVEPATIEVLAGGVERSVALERASDRVEISGLAIPAGDLDLRVRVLRGSKQEDAYQVVLNRR